MSVRVFKYPCALHNPLIYLNLEVWYIVLKRMIKGTHIHVSANPELLQRYIDEACFRYNNRFKEIDMFGTLIALIPDYRILED